MRYQAALFTELSLGNARRRMAILRILFANASHFLGFFPYRAYLVKTRPMMTKCEQQHIAYPPYAMTHTSLI
ncbi:hypothetical protein QWZ16_21820 [Vibrio ostreicida]|uniref:DUF3265 domain-containing protein n=1 Tax=Vibrio ostreicida TaxID=526588 RepID=A0ABT8BZH7_9VIBR|nr:hypothetical protein [Vibrio ostreicida]MDN3612237.1 hypothetical protein [Vibrio ostreicida]